MSKIGTSYQGTMMNRVERENPSSKVWIISFISALITIIMFLTGFQTLGELIRSTKYIKAKKIEIKNKLNMEKLPISFEIYNSFRTNIDSDNNLSIEYAYDNRIHAFEAGSHVDVKVKKKLLFFDIPHTKELVVTNFQIRQTFFNQYDSIDPGFNVGEIQISGVIQWNGIQYVCYLFGTIPYNSRMEVDYFGIGSPLNKNVAQKPEKDLATW